MSKKEAIKKDLTIEDEILKPKEGDAVTLRVLKIPCDNKTDKAFRIFNGKNEPEFYRSTRLGTLDKTDNGLKADVTGFEKEIAGRKYELCEVKTKEVLMQGKIIFKVAAVAQVSEPAAVNQ